MPLNLDPTRAARGRHALSAQDPADRLSEVLGDLMHMAATDGVDFGDALELASQAFAEEAGGFHPGAAHGIVVTFATERGAEAFNNVFSYPLLNVVLQGGTAFNCQRQVFTYNDDDQLVMHYKLWDDELQETVGPTVTVPVAEIVAIHIR